MLIGRALAWETLGNDFACPVLVAVQIVDPDRLEVLKQ